MPDQDQMRYQDHAYIPTEGMGIMTARTLRAQAVDDEARHPARRPQRGRQRGRRP